jgi:hypothetical protein
MEYWSADEVKRFAAGGPAPPRKVAKPIHRFKGRDNTKYGKRHVPGQMNGTESAYAELLRSRELGGEIIAWHFESVTFKLAQDTRYTPDFCVQLPDGSMEFVDAKGGGPIDPKSLVKIKVAAEKFPQFMFVIEKRLSKKDGGGWKRTEF